MCRFLAYAGTPILMDQLIFQPQNSLIHQSYHALERQDPVNGDGFGIGWYVPDVSPEPVRYVSVKPAWNDRNLRSIATKTKAGCFFAHVRDASVGAVCESNCHPFHYGPFLMMHNGRIEGFKKIKRTIINLLSENVFEWLSGETDSEHFFALFLNCLFAVKKVRYSTEDLVAALFKSIAILKKIFCETQPQAHFYLNLAITDGRDIIACRYDTNVHVASPTLYYSSGGFFQCEDGVCRMADTGGSEKSVLVVSEKLTNRRDEWHKIPEEHLVIIRPDLQVHLMPLKIE
ncbi:MAG: class II glutamine amidotransferase [Deferribacteres bacterium]|nr:class II glutamine amidotransferase [candidate division KSB1 bacterium]MCB9503913.1 class II glutamine amidotransferase [Deferribacteres bacterium]